MAIVEEDHISEEIHNLKQEGNAKFQAKDYDGALSTYLDVLAKLPPRPLPLQSSEADQESDGEEGNSESRSEDAPELSAKARGKQKEVSAAPETEEDRQVRKLRCIIYSNTAATHIRLKQYKEAVKACNESLLDDPDYVKSLYRRAQANEEIGGWSGYASALEDYRKLLENKDLPNSTRPNIVAAIKRLDPLAQQAATKEKDEMLQKLKGLGDSLLGNFGLSTNNFKFTQQPGGGYSMNFVR